jgi:hypothetical protein
MMCSISSRSRPACCDIDREGAILSHLIAWKNAIIFVPSYVLFPLSCSIDDPQARGTAKSSDKSPHNANIDPF